MTKHNSRKYNKKSKRNTRRRYRKRGGYDIKSYGLKHRSLLPHTSSIVTPKIHSMTPKMPQVSLSMPNVSKKSLTHHLKNVGTHAKNIAQKAKDTFHGFVKLITPDTEEDKKTFEVHSQPNEAPKALIGGKRKSKRSKTHRRKHKRKHSRTRRRR